MIWKLLKVAEKRFMKLKGSELLPEVYAGKIFVDGKSLHKVDGVILEEKSSNQEAAWMSVSTPIDKSS